jgi:exosortase A
MTASTLAPAAIAHPWRLLRPAIPALGIGIAVWAALFFSEITHAVEVWNASTAYSHCWFVLPIAAYLAWDRRAEAAGIPLRPMLWPALLVIPGSLVWLAAERVGIMEGRQLAAMGFVELLFLCVLGWRLAWAFSAALLYLFFLVPFGAFITNDLQRFTAWFTDVGLQVLGIPYFIDQFTIEIPGGTFYIAEACAGLRFLIAAIAFGVLYACLIYRSPWRRAAFMLASCIIPVIANGFRALGIVVLGYVLGSAEAAATDHIIYGWLFFSFVILMLILAGLPFREDTGSPRIASVRPVPASPTGSPWTAAAAVVVLAALGPATVAAVDYHIGSAPPAIALPAFVPGPGCIAAGTPAPGLQRFACGGFDVTATVRAFPPRVNPAVLITAQRDAGAEDRAKEIVTGRITAGGAQPFDWRLAETEQPDLSTATALWIDGDPGLAGLRGRLRQARNSLLGTATAPVLVAVSVEAGDAPMDRRQREEARRVIAAFLDAQGDLQAQVLRLAREAAQ